MQNLTKKTMDFDKICMIFTMQEPYYGIILSSMERVPVSGHALMGVTRNGNVFRLLYNPEMVSKLDVPTTLQLLKHEVLHLAFNHFHIWEDENPPQNIQKLRNIAADLEANCYLNMNEVHDITILHPSQFGWEKELGTREYFKKLIEEAQKQQQKQQQKASKNVQKPCDGGMGGQSDEDDDEECDRDKNENKNEDNTGREQEKQEEQPSSGNGNQDADDEDSEDEKDEEEWDENELSQEFVDSLTELDDHSQWPTGDDADNAEQIVEDMLLQAADEVEKGRGTIPNELNSRIAEIRLRRKPRPVADWKRYVRRYLGHEFSEFLRKSRKRESKRFPDACGSRHRRKSHILVGIDTSGSVSMPEYKEFFGQIRTLSSAATFDVVECDAMIQKVYQFRNTPNMDIHGGGGTSYEPVIDMYWKNIKKYDALIYFTDGECYVPNNTPKDTLWVISSRGDKRRTNEFRKNGASVVFIPPKTD